MLGELNREPLAKVPTHGRVHPYIAAEQSLDLVLVLAKVLLQRCAHSIVVLSHDASSAGKRPTSSARKPTGQGEHVPQVDKPGQGNNQWIFAVEDAASLRVDYREHNGAGNGDDRVQALVCGYKCAWVGAETLDGAVQWIAGLFRP
ncbi:MAG TPA: hypothetical protein VE033_01555 [Acetobacteraceae bacterium]|nr:hypothetical protein [Acetobacteraceae bacterium]